MSDLSAFVPPPYPYERLGEVRHAAEALPGGCVDLSVGTPCDAPPPAVVHALASSKAERGYPLSVGTAAFREAAAAWMQRRLGVTVAREQIAACVGTKEFVASVPRWLRLRMPARDTVLYPAVSYPTYAMGALLAGCRGLPYGRLADVPDADAARALCVWVNSPANPTGKLDDLAAAAAWGRAHDVAVFSDECYVEFTWNGPGRTILTHGLDGVVAVHSLSKRSNLAGVRVGFYAGDGALVRYLVEVRKHAGLMVPAPSQAAAEAALNDDSHVSAQRERYWPRLRRLQTILRVAGVEAPLPEGTFYLWATAPGGDAWGLTKRLAVDGGVLVSPGEFYGELAAGSVRLAAVQPDERLELIARRLGAA